MSFTRLKQRTDTYANWEAQNNNTPGGLKILQGEICVIIADADSASAGLSNAQVITGIPLKERLPNTGEVLGTKIGQGFATRWDEIPTNFHIPQVNFANGTGRVLGTRNNGGTHVYKHPGEMFRAIFGPVYSPPRVSATLYDAANSNLNGALLEMGQEVTGVRVGVNPQAASFPIKLGRAFESTSGRVQLVTPQADETALPPATIGQFNRLVVPGPFRIDPANSNYNTGNGLYRRSFFAEVTDNRPGVDGGNYTTGSNGLDAYAAYPTFFGKSAAPLPVGEAAIGAFLQANFSPMIRARSGYDAGNVAYVNGERSHFAYPAAYGPLAKVLNALGGDTMAVSFNAPVTALLTKVGRYANIPYLVYRSKDPGYNNSIIFNFQF